LYTENSCLYVVGIDSFEFFTIVEMPEPTKLITSSSSKDCAPTNHHIFKKVDKEAFH